MRRRRRIRESSKPAFWYLMTVQAVFWIILGIALTLGGGALLIYIIAETRGAALVFGLLLGLLVTAWGALYSTAGIGILMKTPWGYDSAKSVCYIMLIKIPLGTLIGALSLMYLSANAEYYKGKTPK